MSENYVCLSCKDPSYVFVFGSNFPRGVHGAGAARHALEYHEAIWGMGVGFQGSSYAIPTKDEDIQTLPLENVREYIKQFIVYAKANPDKKFFVTRIGCGLAGFQDIQIAPLFADAPSNCILPNEWKVNGTE